MCVRNADLTLCHLTVLQVYKSKRELNECHKDKQNERMQTVAGGGETN